MGTLFYDNIYHDVSLDYCRFENTQFIGKRGTLTLSFGIVILKM